MSRRPQKIKVLLATRIGQGLSAFFLGGVVLGGLASVLFQFTNISLYIVSQLTYAPDPYHPWTDGIMLANNLLLLLATILQMIIPTALAAGAVIMGLCWWLGLKPAGQIVRNIVLWAVLATALVYAINFSLIFIIDWQHLGVFGQTVTAYAQILSLGLPFSFAWLYSTRHSKLKPAKPL